MEGVVGVDKDGGVEGVMRMEGMVGVDEYGGGGGGG